MGDAETGDGDRMKLTTLEEIREARAALPDAVRLTPIVALARDSREIGAERL